MRPTNREPTYIFDEAVADRFRTLAYNFLAAIDELLARTRVEPLEAADIGFEEFDFWASRAALHEQLTKNGDDA